MNSVVTTPVFMKKGLLNGDSYTLVIIMLPGIYKIFEKRVTKANKCLCEEFVINLLIKL